MKAMASLAVPEYLRGKFDMDDVVQGALLKVHQNRQSLEGRSQAEQRAYYRKALESVLADGIGRFKTKGRHTAQERSLEAAFDDSSGQLGRSLAADQTSPSGRASRDEQSARLAAALALLPPDQRQAVELHHLQKMSVKETAAAMVTTKGAVAGLIRRGLKHLRELLQD